MELEEGSGHQGKGQFAEGAPGFSWDSTVNTDSQACPLGYCQKLWKAGITPPKAKSTMTELAQT